MSDWDAALYRQFEAERTRPAADLLAQVHLASPRTVVDLGCGPGNSTELLAHRFPDAEVIGVDLSPDMLAKARARLPGCAFIEGSIETWMPARPPDLIFANASLQWVGGHEALLPRLLGSLAPGGVLAVQMPHNRNEASHAAMRAIAAEPAFSGEIAHGATERVAVLSTATYYDLLSPVAASLDVWLTTYHHPMPGPDAIVDWLRSTGLRPFLDALAPARQTDFLRRYREEIDRAYPARADGRRLLAFPRLFLVATRA